MDALDAVNVFIVDSPTTFNVELNVTAFETLNVELSVDDLETTRVSFTFKLLPMVE